MQDGCHGLLVPKRERGRSLRFGPAVTGQVEVWSFLFAVFVALGVEVSSSSAVCFASHRERQSEGHLWRLEFQHASLGRLLGQGLTALHPAGLDFGSGSVEPPSWLVSATLVA